MKHIEKFIHILVVTLVSSVSVYAQTPPAAQAEPAPPGFTSWCLTTTTGLQKSARKMVELRCELELAEAKAAVEKVHKAEERRSKANERMAKTVASVRTHTGPDGKTTDEFDATPSGAKQELDLAKINASVAKHQADANRPVNPCGSWIMAPSYCYGYAVGGYVTPYSSYSTGYYPQTVVVTRQPQRTGGQPANSQYSGGRSYGGGR